MYFYHMVKDEWLVNDEADSFLLVISEGHDLSHDPEGRDLSHDPEEAGHVVCSLYTVGFPREQSQEGISRPGKTRHGLYNSRK